ncbi:hypothetical protein [Mixta mediterraneensis]|nr:hypothetical protein [Mixta mediterraneensis]
MFRYCRDGWDKVADREHEKRIKKLTRGRKDKLCVARRNGMFYRNSWLDA